MSFGLRDEDWVDPPDPKMIKCRDCDEWTECPCGHHGWCSYRGEHTWAEDECEC